MPIKPDSSANDSAIKASRPKGLVKLLFVRNTAPSFDWYIRFPIQSGPQPLLGVRKEDKDFQFPDPLGFVPKKLERELCRSSQLPITLPLPQRTFSDALTVLPTSFPHSKTAAGQPDIVYDSVLLAAMGILTIEYSQLEAQRRTDKAFMDSIPASTADVKFRPEGGKRFTDKIRQLLTWTQEESKTSTLPDLHGHLIHLLRWTPWNLVSGHTNAQRWGDLWKILKCWHRWEMLDMSFPERAYDLAQSPTLTPVAPAAFNSLGEALRKRCRRMGLEARPAIL